MKKRTTFIGVAFLTAILMLSVGYAAITNVDLNVTGSADATVNDANFKVNFTGETTTTKTNSKSTVTATANLLNAEIKVTDLSTKGDKATATYTIKNESLDLKALLSLDNLNNDNSNYFNVTQELAKNTLNGGETTTLTLTVELVKTPTTPQTANISTKVIAQAQES